MGKPIGVADYQLIVPKEKLQKVLTDEIKAFSEEKEKKINWASKCQKQIIERQPIHFWLSLLAYAFPIKMTDSECVAELFKKYAEMVE